MAARRTRSSQPYTQVPLPCRLSHIAHAHCPAAGRKAPSWAHPPGSPPGPWG